MSKVLIDEANLTAIGDAIRAKNESTTKYKPSQMATAISNIKSTIEYTTGDLQVVSPDSWSLNIIQTEHQTITASLVGTIAQSAEGEYYPAISATVSIIPATGYTPGAVQKGADKSTKTYNVTASAAEEIEGMVENGWGKVYESGVTFYSDESYSTQISTLGGDILVAGMKNADCSSINRIFYGKTLITKLKNSFITGAGSYFLNSCPALTEADFPNLVTMGSYCIQSCTSLKSVNLPNLTTVGDYFLYGCTALETVDFPSLTSVGDYFLYGCNNLKVVFLRSPSMCAYTGSMSFTKFSSTSIYVPESLIESYKTVSPWSSSASQFKTFESIQLSKLLIQGVSVLNVYNGEVTKTYTVQYNDGIALPEQTGVTWSVTGNATISPDGVLTTSNANDGDVITVTATSTYDSSISASITVSVINTSCGVIMDLNNGQWVDSGTTVDGHTVYKSDAGSYNVDNGKSTCTVTVFGYSKVTVYLRSYAEGNWDFAELGPLDGTVSRGNTSNVLSTKGKQSSTTYSSYTFEISDDAEHTFQVLYSKDSSTNSSDDRGYFYLVCK